MYLTNEILDSIIADLYNEREALGEFKKRGKGRVYTSPETDTYILDTYSILLCNNLKKLIKKGNYSIDRVVEHLRSFEWKTFKYAYAGKELKKLLGIRYKNESDLFYYSVQTRYLKRAADSICGILETYMWQ